MIFCLFYDQPITVKMRVAVKNKEIIIMKNLKKITLAVSIILSLSLVYSFYSKKFTAVELPHNFDQSLVENTVSNEIQFENETVKQRKIAENYGKIPLHFEPNQGQTVESVKFYARGKGYGIFLQDKSATLFLQETKDQKPNSKSRTAILQMNLVGANSAESAGQEELPGKTNYFIGNDASKWQSDVSNYGKVKFEKVYDGVDLVYYGNQRRLEYDFVVAPNADTNQIKLNFEGAKSVKLDEKSGDLLLETALGTIRQHKPFAYQQIDGERLEIAAVYKVQSPKSKVQSPKSETSTISIALGDYDKSKELIIDPILAYSSFLGGDKNDYGTDIAVDADGNAYVTGYTLSVNFPVTPGALKTTLLPIASTVYGWDAFVSKINPTGTGLVYSTYLGTNSGSDIGYGIAVDSGGNAYITGTTDHASFPIVNAQQPTYGGNSDAFIAKLNPTGSALLFSTFYGGSFSDNGQRIRLVNGDLYLTGSTTSSNFPTTTGVLKPAPCSGAGCATMGSDAFAAKFNTNGIAQWATLLGGNNAEFGFDLALDANNNSYVVGYTLSNDFPATAGAFQTTYGGGTDGFAAKINSSGTTLDYATYLGGGLQSDRIWSVDVDAGGNAYLAGQTENSSFPTTAGAFDTVWNNSADAFLTKLNPTGTGLVYSTFLGGTGADKAFAVKVAPNGEAFLGGETGSANLNFPLRNSLQGNLGSMFLTRFNAAGSDIVFSSLLGTGSVKSIALDATNNAYLTGEAHYLQTTAGAFQPTRTGSSTIPDGFVMKIGATDENSTVYSISGTVSDVTTSGGQIIVTLTGTVNRQVILSGTRQYSFGGLTAGGNYTVSARRIGYLTTPENAVFNNLQANQFADFTILPNAQPVGEITSPVHGTTYNIPATITIQANASDPDGHAIQKVDFVAYSSSTGNVPLGTDTTAPYEFTWTNVPVGTWALYAIPTDELGLQGYSTPTTHVFVVDGTAPAVSITSPTEGQSFVEGDYVPLTAVVSSSVSLVEFYDQNNTLIGRRAAAPWTTTWRAMTVGNYTITAKGFNSQGQSGTSAPVNIAIIPINHRITGRVVDSVTNAGVANVVLNLTSPTNPNITANTTTDESGNYLFTNLGTTPNDGVIITPSLNNFSFSPATRNIGFLGYIEWPNQSFTATRQTQISVAMTSPTNGATFVAPATINLAANASSGAGTITKVEFYRQFGTNALLGTDTTAPYEFQLTNIGAGSYTYFARAYDSTGAIADSSTVSVSVTAPSTTVRLQGDITNPGGGWMPGITVRLTGTANGNPINQTSVSNSFGAYGFFNLPAGGNYTITPQTTGTMTFTPESQSFTNATIDNLDVDFVSSAGNQPPTVTLNNPTDGSTYNLPTPIPVSATASDIDGTIINLKITAIGNSFATTIGETNNGTLNFNWTPNLPGAYTLHATAKDNGGFQTTVTINITVTNNTPVSIAGRIVDRNSNGIEGATLELKNSQETIVIATATTNANGNYTMANVPSFANYVLRASKQDYTFSPQKRTYFNVSANQTNADYTGTLQVQPSDFDGDGMSDFAVWRPSNGVWHVQRSGDNSYNSLQFGGEAFGDVAVPGNYDGDKKTDYAVYRSGVWYIWQSSNGQVRIAQFGLADDKPVAGDYDGDGKTDLAVWRGSTGVWYIWRSSDGGYDYRQFGLNGDIPLAGDYDGDGKTDITIWRPATGVWYIQQSSDGGYRSYQFGINGDTPLVGDFDGDKMADYTIFRPSTGVWYVNLSSNGDFKILQWGISTDIPVPGDFDRDGKTDFGVFRPAEGNWYVFKSSTNSYVIQHFGMNGDMPIPAAYR